jgi:eukaryotic-like serine/threonine-protein kinase
MTLSTGQILQNHYRVDALLNQGGFGAIYRGVDLNLNRPVAIKENLDTSPEAQQQFLREAQLLANLSHPNLPRVTDHFFIPGVGQYLVMDYIEGEDLQSMLDRTHRPLPEAQALAWITQVCDALAYLHGQNPPIVHRDIKPANIKITMQGQAMLVDFGIAKVYDAQMKTTLGARAVTPPYSPPEQYGSDITDPRSDIYALGATLYVLLTGYQPPESVARMSSGLPLMPPRQLMPTLAPSVEAAILRACDVSKTQRYPSVQEFQQALFTSPRLPPTTVLPGQPPAPAWNAQPSAPPPTWNAQPPAWNAQPSTPQVAWNAQPSAPPPAWNALPPSSAPAWNIPPSTPVPTWGAPPSQNSKKKQALWLLLLIPIILIGAFLLWQILSKTSPQPVPSGNGSTQISDKDGMTMLRVPAGEFVMGSNTGADSEKPEHTVYLDAFWIDQTEVTNAMFQKFADATGYRTDTEKTGSGRVFDLTTKKWTETKGVDWLHPRGPVSSQSGPDHPIVQISWNDAAAYCAWAGRRLPTEAEWEKAARGSDRRTYPWGNQPVAGNLLNFADRTLEINAADKNVDDSYQFTAPVGHYPAGASPYGAFDMAGNVWEWVADWYDETYYASSPAKNPTGPASGTARVMRGGSWDVDALWVTTTRRGGYDLYHGSSNIGFRCAR